ncbi:MFS transporter [Actinocorallia longicatena]|uniref:MFS transporter n=1 Tax=Actinocorallia longicatena TaxID=111803 RepID=A0ABP6Q251_9ACTN
MTQTLAQPPAGAERPARSGAVLAVLLTGLLMAMIDISIVNVALPSIASSLHASGADLQLVATGYTIVYAVLLVTGARLGARMGHGRAFRLGLAVFTLASLLCGLAWGTGALIAFRGMQGAGAAVMLPQVLSLIQRTFDGPARAVAMRRYAAVLAGGGVVGQVLGGALVSADLTDAAWRPVFLVNVPIGLVLLVAAGRILPSLPGPARGHDVPGLLVLSPAVLAFVVPLVLGHERGWPLWGWITLAGSAVLFGLFALTQRRSAAPLVPGRLLRLPGMRATILAMFVAMAVFAGTSIAMTLHFQGGLGYSALETGLAFLPTAIAFAFISLSWGRLPARHHRSLSTAGFAVASAGTAAQAAAFSGGGTHGWWLYPALAVGGLGMGAAFGPLMALLLTRVPPADAAEASGILGMVIQLSQVVGVATLGTLYLSLARTGGSAHAVTVTLLAAAALLLAGAACSFLLRTPVSR